MAFMFGQSVASIPGKEDPGPQAASHHLSDPELVARCQHGEREALETLFTRAYPNVRRILIRLYGPGPELEDLVQSTMLEIHRGLKRFRGDSQLSSWVFRIAMNVANQHLRRKMREPGRVDMEAVDAMAGDPDALNQMETNERLKMVAEILQSLPEKKRNVFLLAELEQLSSEQIAEVLGCSVSAVWSRLHQARKLFWEKINRHGYFSGEENEG